ncbi:c-type cytochrome [Bradyrhizobium sp. Arg237L]|uniref:c-type cytochrome n=1 Tax=Bradyrhizobium sp. Arg237L TaxID=3003352 RepID=UPI00249F7660|nr:c-type cytochrome [Bradyrhizobium sp. Arg237L]MDI4239080.1 c-type cytochrome [Bradyrhizobium sp. Arg237L]
MVISAVLGFAVLSRYQQNAAALGLWDAICRGLGISTARDTASLPKASASSPTRLAWTADTLAVIRAGDAKHGAFVAANCAACHQSSRENLGLVIPRLDGIDATAIYKQLEDYRTGARSWGVMGAIATALTRKDSADVAAYYATRPAGLGRRLVSFSEREFNQTDPARRLAFIGDPKRGIAPCAACHGPAGYKLGAPDLYGQRSGYIERQLAAFAQNTRRNDMYATMRMVARQLTVDERKALAAYYGGQDQSGSIGPMSQR